MGTAQDSVTFTVTFPSGALFDATIDALRSNRDAQIKIGNLDAAQALQTILALAEGGRTLFNTSSILPHIQR